MDLCIKYQTIFTENMWKYVTRRIRDTCERSANRCSTTIVNGAAITNDEKNESAPCKWIAFRREFKSYQNDNDANTTKWSFEFDHQDTAWTGAIPWANEKELNHDKNAGPTNWFPFPKGCRSFHNHNGGNDKRSLEHLDTAQKDVIPWGKTLNEKHFDDNAGPPCKWFSFGKGTHDRNANNMKWNFDHQDRTLVNEIPLENESNEENTATAGGSPCKWFSFRRRCGQKENEPNSKKLNFEHLNRSQMDVAPWVNEQNNDKKAGPPCKWLSFRKCRKSYQNGSRANSKKWNFEPINKTWMDAITWSGAAVLGWYTSQLIHFKLKHHCSLLENKSSSVNNLLSSILPYVPYMNKSEYYISSVEKIEKLVSDFTPTVHLMSNDKYESLKKKENISSSSTSSDTDTTDDDLGEVLNSIENRLGLAAIENGQYQDGLSLLRSAAHRNHAPAIYNLGLCYEKGLGVTANEKTAMELYKSAAALDHPEALYNLGIYYGQGRGGLKADQETAVRLLRLAAVQGQQAAIDALKYLDVSISEPRHNDVNTWDYQHPPFSSNEHIVPTQSRLFIDNINYLQARV